MILHAENRERAVSEAFERLIVQIPVRQFDIGGGQRIRVHGKAVIMGRDLDLVGGLVQNGMISATVPEFQLVGFSAKRQPEDLMSQADAENRFLAEELSDVGRLDLERRGIARPVGEENTVGFQAEHILGRC